MMTIERPRDVESAGLPLLGRADARVLTPEEERALLVELDELRRILAAGEAERRGVAADDVPFQVQEFVRALLAAGEPEGNEDAVLLGVAARYAALRTRLAMANVRLVAHVAGRYRNRGLSTSDLLQEGFCGLLTAIDRYEVANETRLASYAVWWIRQALQRAVAAGVYPVRLNPRHLQKLAQGGLDEDGPAVGRPRSASAEATLRRIQAATRPAVSLDAPLGGEGRGSLLDTLSSPDAEDHQDFEREQRLSALIEQLRPRERQVLQLRYGLDGCESQSLSQVSAVLGVSKERVRQIQDAALTKLREAALRDRACCEVG